VPEASPAAVVGLAKVRRKVLSCTAYLVYGPLVSAPDIVIAFRVVLVQVKLDVTITLKFVKIVVTVPE